jgi:hypothetical protein
VQAALQQTYASSVGAKVKTRLWVAVQNVSSTNLLLLRRGLPKAILVAGVVLTILWISLLAYLPLYLFLPMIAAIWG